MPDRKDQALWLFIIVMALILAGSFLPLSMKSGMGFGIKTGIFVALFFLLYFFWYNSDTRIHAGKWISQNQPSNNDKYQQEEISSPLWKGFGDAFQWFYGSFLSIVRNVTAASVSVLYLRKGDQLELQTAQSESKDSYTQGPVREGSLIDYVIQTNGAVREGNLPLGTVLSGIDDVEIRSFVGVPLIIENKIAGILATGSEAQDHFSEEDEELLIRCAQVICQVMSVYHRAWRREIQETLLQTLIEMEQALKPAENEEQAFNVFIKFLKRLFVFDRCTLCYQIQGEGEIRQVFGQIDHLDRGTRFSMDEGLVGWVMKRHAPLIVEDIQDVNYIRPRYYEGEDTKHGLHAFLGVPLGEKEAWGCIALESRRTSQYQEREKNGLLNILPFFELTLERIRLSEQFKNRS